MEILKIRESVGTMKKNALVITYHVKNCQRVGGFHYFINYLEKLSYNIDWVTCPVSLSWVFHKSDRENLKNFLDLWRGITFEENNVTIRHFSTPVLIPAKIVRMFKMEKGYHYWPAWKKLRKRMKPQYDVILVEGVGCQYACELRKDYPKAQIIYRPSDILETFSSVPDAVEIERKMIKSADITVCVDENQMNYYKKIAPYNNLIRILRNPITSENDLIFVKNWKPKESIKKAVVYLGVSFVDLDLIEYTANKINTVEFYIIGPHPRKTHDNVQYLGVLSKNQYEQYLKEASVAISPLNGNIFNKNNQILPGYTGKIISYMKYLLPIVATNCSNYLNTKGFYVANSKEEFCKLVEIALGYTLEEREALREGYLTVMEEFLDRNIESEFKKIVEGKIIDN